MSRSIFAVFLLFLLCGCVATHQRNSAESLLKYQLYHGQEWKRIHAAEALLEADLASDEITRIFIAELNKSVPGSPWRIGCLRVLYQSCPPQQADCRTAICTIALNRKNEGIVHAVETMGKLRFFLRPKEEAALKLYANDNNLLASYALMVLSINRDKEAFAQLIRLFQAGNTTAAFALFYLDEYPEEYKSNLIAMSNDASQDPVFRAFAFRARAKFGTYSEPDHAELLRRIQTEQHAGALRFYLLTVGDFNRPSDATLLTPYLESLDSAHQIAAAASLVKILKK